MQDLCLEAHRDIAQFRGRSEGEFVCWLRKVFATIVSNQVRRYLGTRRRDLRREQPIAVGRDDTSRAVVDRRLVAPQSSPSQQAARRERAELLAEALDTLPETYREVIVLRNIEGLSFSDVAARLGRTEDSVKNIWLRGPRPTSPQVGGPFMRADSRGGIPESGGSNPDGSTSSADDPRVAAGLDEYLAELQAGHRPSRQEFLARHPEIADALDRGLDVLEFLHSAAGVTEPRAPTPADGDALPPETVLGDYRLIREVGRGGMGVVYEARADLARPPGRGQGALGRRRRSTRGDCSGSASRPRRSRSSTTRTSCPSSPSAPIAASTTTPCSTSRAAPSPRSSRITPVAAGRASRPRPSPPASGQTPRRSSGGPPARRADRARAPMPLPSRAGRRSGRSPSSASRPPRPWITPTPWGSCIATSSPRTC